MPNGVCALVLESGARDLGTHTEMLTDGLGTFTQPAAGSRKALDPGKVVYNNTTQIDLQGQTASESGWWR